MLFCELCADYRHADDFSAGQRRNPPEWTVGGQGRRFCLRHRLREQNNYIERLRRHARAAIRGDANKAGEATPEQRRHREDNPPLPCRLGPVGVGMVWTPEPRDATPQQRQQSPESECATLSASHDDSDSADSHSQDVGEVGGEEEHAVQEMKESCDDGNTEQASDGQEAENNDVTKAGVVNLQHSDFENVEQTSERASVLPARARLQHIRLDNDSGIVSPPKSHPQQ